MKRAIILLFVLVSVGSYGQRAFEANDKILNIGFSVGYYGYGFSGSRSINFLPVNASLEFGITDEISIGPYIGLANWRYRTSALNYNYRFINVGARGTFHATPTFNNLADASLDEKTIDLYLSILAGFEIRQFDGDDILGLSNDVVVRLGPVLGLKYMLARNFGVYAEIGRGTLGLFTFGVSARF